MARWNGNMDRPNIDAVNCSLHINIGKMWPRILTRLVYAELIFRFIHYKLEHIRIQVLTTRKYTDQCYWHLDLTHLTVRVRLDVDCKLVLIIWKWTLLSTRSLHLIISTRICSTQEEWYCYPTYLYFSTYLLFCNIKKFKSELFSA